MRIGRPDSKVTCRFENFESAAHAVCRHTTKYAHSTKTSTFAPFVVWDICLQLHFTCSCTAVARAHTQLPHDNRNWTCKRLPPDSVQDSIRIRIVAAYSIRDSIPFSNGNIRFAGPYFLLPDKKDSSCCRWRTDCAMHFVQMQWRAADLKTAQRVLPRRIWWFYRSNRVRQSGG